jgi:SNF2 family DNA or RNA helicase
MAKPLWKHQQAAISYVQPLAGGGLFLEMGCGKTRCALELLEIWQIKKALIVCPKAVVDVWPDQAEEYFPGGWSVHPINGKTPSRKMEQIREALGFARAGEKVMIVINYESAWREPVGKALQTAGIQCIVLDEMHRIKSPGGKASRFFSQIGKTTRRRLGLTGTPLPHSPLDAYAQYRFLDPKIFGYSFVGFRSRYAIMRPIGNTNAQTVQSFVNLDELHDRMYSIAYRVQSADVLELPETMDIIRRFDLSPQARRIYDDLEQDLMAEIGDGEIISTPNILTKLLRLQQLTGGWVPVDESDRVLQVDTGKPELLADILEDISADEPIVVFCRFRKEIESVRQICENMKIPVAEISGAAKELKAFQSGAARLVVCQITSGGLGIDLTRSRYCFYYSTGYSLGDVMQSRARTHRPGQTRPVTYFHLLARDTIDEDIYKGLQQKGDLVTMVLDTMRKRRDKGVI